MVQRLTVVSQQEDPGFSDEFVYAIQTVFTTPNNIHVGHKEYLAKMESQEQELSPSGYMMLPTAYK